MYFFVDPAQLLTQTPAQAYGPVQSQEDTHYRVTSKFQVKSDTPAIAALGGVVLVQPHATDPALCNVAIKVDDPADARTQFDKIDYLLYRGLRRDSFLTAATTPTLLPKDPTNSDLVARLWQAQEQAQQDAVKLGLALTMFPPTPDNLGFNRLNPGQTLEAAFADTSYFYPLFKLEAGCSLGTFASGIEAGFEVVVFDRFYQPTVGDLRRAEMVFEVPATPGSTAGHDADYTTQRTRENILNYIDPAAYYTMHYRGGVSYKDASGSYTCPTVELIGSKLLDAFLPAKNRIYLDIRNELGGSLNFYRDNEGPAGFEDQHFKYGFAESDMHLASYYTYKWPIFSVPVDPAPATSTYLLVQVRKTHNPRPLLFVDYGYPGSADSTQPLAEYQRFQDVTTGLGSTAEWSNWLRLPLLPPTLPTAHPLWFFKLMCIRQQVPADLATVAPSAPPREYALNNVFGPITADLLSSTGATSLLLPGKRFMASLTGEGGAIVMVRKLLGTSIITLRAERLFTYLQNFAMPVLGSQYLAPPTITAEAQWQDLTDQYTDAVTIQRPADSALTVLRQRPVASLAKPLRYPNPSVTLTHLQVQQILLPTLAAFDPARDAAWLTFNTVSRQLTGRRELKFAQPADAYGIAQRFVDLPYVDTKLTLSGLLNNATYRSNPPATVLSAYSLDSVVFNTEAGTFDLSTRRADTEAYFSVERCITYLQAVETAYAAEDATALDTATRLRVRYYGNDKPNDGYPLMGTFAGFVFDKVVQGVKYYDYNPRPGTDVGVQLGTSVRLDFDRMQKVPGGVAAYNHFMARADENGVQGNPSPYIVVRNPATGIFDYVDLGHMLYGFEAWQQAALGTSKSFRLLQYPVEKSQDLAGIVGDIGPAIGEFVYRLENPGSHSGNSYYPLDNDLGKFYAISNPDPDSHSDADGLGLHYAYNSLKAAYGTTPVKLSQVFALYYAPTPLTGSTIPGLTGHPLATHYSRKWLTLAMRYNFLIPGDKNQSVYDQDEFYWIGNYYTTPLVVNGEIKTFEDVYNDLYNRVLAVSNVLYNQEFIANKVEEGVFLLLPDALSVLPEHVDAFAKYKTYIQMDDILHAHIDTASALPPGPYQNTAAVITATLKTYFFPDLKRKLQAENSRLRLR